jgi:hypothetical protein
MPAHLEDIGTEGAFISGFIGSGREMFSPWVAAHNKP